MVDANGQQVDGDVATVTDVEPLDARFAAFGVDTMVVDGHDVGALVAALSRTVVDGPAVTICRTRPDHGLPIVATVPAQRRHGLWFASDEEFQQAVAALEVDGG